MNFGLSQADLDYITSVIARFPEIKKAVIFGSRAKGNNQPGADIDLAIFGESVTFDTLSRLHALLEDQSPLPYFFDVVDYTHTTNQNLKEHIEKVEKVIYQV